MPNAEGGRRLKSCRMPCGLSEQLLMLIILIIIKILNHLLNDYLHPVNDYLHPLPTASRQPQCLAGLALFLLWKNQNMRPVFH